MNSQHGVDESSENRTVQKDVSESQVVDSKLIYSTKRTSKTQKNNLNENFFSRIIQFNLGSKN